jgi:outer membrane receptor protein involved in Fe transport
MRALKNSVVGTRNLLLASGALAAVIGGSCGAAYAQDGAEEEDTIVVTGSRIARPGFNSNSPITTVNAAELDLQQPVDIEEVLRGLPQFLPGVGSQVNNGSAGVSTLNLRGLTEPRTLVMLDSSRMVAFDTSGLVDVTAIPIALLERVDVVTGGASAVYGSDAMAGVVNFILKDDFSGAQFDYDRTFTDAEHGDATTNHYSMTLGAALDEGRGNVVLNIGYLDKPPVYQTFSPGSDTPGASTTTIPTAIDSAVGDRSQVAPNGDLVPFYQGFDFNPQNLYQTPQQRWTALALGSYEINENVEAYARALYSNSRSAPQLASSGTFGFEFAVPLDNPFLSPAAVSYLTVNNPVDSCANLEPYGAAAPPGDCVRVGLRRRTTEVGARQFVFEYNTFQFLGGLRGELRGGWEWDVAAAHGETALARQQNNDVSALRTQQSLFAIDANTCFDPSGLCAPFNFFDPSTPVTADAARFIGFNLQVQAKTTQRYATGNLTGDLGELTSPFAQSPIGLAFGAEYREETSDYQPDAASQSGESPGFGQTLPTTGQYDVMEFFGEALVPLVEDAPLADFINLELGYRTSDYSLSGRVETYKYGLEWQPFEGLRLRAMQQQAIRAANISELFDPFTPGTGDLAEDPCAAGTPADPIDPLSDLYVLCLATGAPASRLDSGTLPGPTSGQVNNFSGGNIGLTPEVADTRTFGFVFQPSVLPGFSATVDYYDIEVSNAISIRPISDIMAGCYDPARNPTADAANASCSIIHRNPTVGNLEGPLAFGVEQTNVNIGSVHVEGIDYGFRYEWDLGEMGAVTFALDGTHALETSYQPSPSSGVVQCLGRYGKACGLPSTTTGTIGGPESEDRWTQRTTWEIGDFELSYLWRHLSATRIDDGSPGSDPASSSIPAYNYIDLSGAWSINDNLRLNLNVTNVTEEAPPFVETETGSTLDNSGNTYPSVYDVLGRVVTVGVSARF